MRRQFNMPEDDISFLKTCGLDWEAVSDGSNKWIVFHDFEIPRGYNQLQVLMAIQIPPGYPDTQMDMMYFDPALARVDGKPIPAIAPTTIDGRSWQRWSRHRTRENPWRPGEDNLAGHVLLVQNWLDREFSRDVR